MQLNFTKMHGLGNDFMVIDAINQPLSLSPEQIRQWSHRHFGIGFDQLLVVAGPEQADVDFTYRIYNADGSEVEQCGNGARCFARFVLDKGLTDKDVIPVMTRGGRILLRAGSDGMITVDMGKPTFQPENIPLSVEQPQVLYDTLMHGQTIHFSAVSMGNPHAVITVDDADQADLKSIGRFLQNSPLFPQSVNVGLMQVLDKQEINLRVYERGVGETLACGTGACAAVATGIQRGLLDREVKVTLPGGDLYIDWPDEEQPLLMTGPAAAVYEGTIEL